MGVIAEGSMGRAKGKLSDRDDIAVKVDKRIIGKAKLVATHQGITLAELLSKLLDLPVDKEYARMLRDLDARSE